MRSEVCFIWALLHEICAFIERLSNVLHWGAALQWYYLSIEEVVHTDRPSQSEEPESIHIAWSPHTASTTPSSSPHSNSVLQNTHYTVPVDDVLCEHDGRPHNGTSGADQDRHTHHQEIQARVPETRKKCCCDSLQKQVWLQYSHPYYLKYRYCGHCTCCNQECSVRLETDHINGNFDSNDAHAPCEQVQQQSLRHPALPGWVLGVHSYSCDSQHVAILGHSSGANVNVGIDMCRLRASLSNSKALCLPPFELAGYRGRDAQGFFPTWQ